MVNLTPSLKPFNDEIDYTVNQKYMFVGPGTGLGVCQTLVM